MSRLSVSQTLEPMTLTSPKSTDVAVSASPQYFPSFLFGKNTSTSNNIYPVSPVSPVKQGIISNNSEFKQAFFDRNVRRHGTPPIHSLWSSNMTPRKPCSDNPLPLFQRPCTPTTMTSSPLINNKFNIPDPVINSQNSPYNAFLREHNTQAFAAQNSPSINSANDFGSWITVFGYPPTEGHQILEHFSHIGKIQKHVISNDGNWMHIKYQNKIQAKCALSKNGRIFPSNIMIGVRPCVDVDLMREYSTADVRLDLLPKRSVIDKSSSLMSPKHGFNSPRTDLFNHQNDILSGISPLLRTPSSLAPVSTPTTSTGAAVEQRTRNVTRHNSMRPLAVSLPPRQIGNRTLNNSFIGVESPKSKPSGILSKAIDLIFGWD